MEVKVNKLATFPFGIVIMPAWVEAVEQIICVHICRLFMKCKSELLMRLQQQKLQVVQIYSSLSYMYISQELVMSGASSGACLGQHLAYGQQ